MVEFLKRDDGDKKADIRKPHALSPDETKIAIAQLLHDTVPPPSPSRKG